MKSNHIKIQQLIQQAISLCGDDFALESTAMNLRRVLHDVADIEKKRNKRNSHAERFKENAKKNQEKWWNQIVENAKKSAEANLENKSTPQQD